MTRKAPHLTSELFRAAHAPDALRDALRSPFPYSKRVVRRKVSRAVADRHAVKPLRGAGL